MDIAEYYGKLPCELSGSRSKNRFRLELLWGVSVMLDLIKEDKDFTIVFDYVCDVEIHFKDALEFHQVKTHGPNAPSYSSVTLTKKKSEQSTGSILGKLYALNKDAVDNVKLVLVSNAPLKIGNKKCDYGEFSLAELPPADKRNIESALKQELGISHVELSRVFYLHTHFDLLEPEFAIQGKLLNRFLEVKHCQPRNAIALYRLILETVKEKACYEYSQKEYDSIVKMKGISRTEFDQMLEAHAENENNGIRQAKEYIDRIKNISKKHRCQNALARLIEQMPRSSLLRDLEARIADFLLSNDIGDESAALALLTDKFERDFPIEYTPEVKELFIVIILGRFTMGAYDHGNDL